MQTTELRFILQHCFTPDSLRALLPDQATSDPYVDAIEAILSDEDSGQRIIHELDEASRSQRNKIRTMSTANLRQALSLEFLDPGRTLGLVVWALLRDSRISAQTIAGELANRFQSAERSNSTLDDHALADAPNDGSATSAEESGVNGAELEVEAMLADLKSLEEEPESSLDEIDEPLGFPIPDETMEEMNELDWKEDEETGPARPQSNLELIPEDEITREVDELINSMGESADILEMVPDSEEELDLESDISLDWDVDQEAEYDDDKPLPFLEDVDLMLDAVKKKRKTAANSEESDSCDDDKQIYLGGVLIRLKSLKEACESIFEESVELVTDDELLGEDRVVVVGKECGIHVMYCSHENILPPPPEEMALDETVTISPDSLRSAFSSVYKEPIEIIPDPNLLNQGIVAFTGKQIGLAVVKHPRIRVPVETWRPAEASWNHESDVAEELADLRTRITLLESRLDLLGAEDAADALLTSGDMKFVDETESCTKDESEEAMEDVMFSPDDSKLGLRDADASPVNHATAEAGELDADLDEIGQLDDLEGLDLDGVLDEEVDVFLDNSDQDQELKPNEISDPNAKKPPSESSTVQGNIDLSEDVDADELALDELSDEDLDLDILNDLDLEEEDFTPYNVFSGEKILLLGGEDEHIGDYDRIIHELGGVGEWYGSLAHMQPGEIHDLVNESDLILLITAEALSDSGIIQAANYARDHNKRLIEHHSSNPTSIQKQLIKIVEEGAM